MMLYLMLYTLACLTIGTTLKSPIILLPLLSGIDILFTYHTVLEYRRYKPEEKKWDVMEQNMVARGIWKVFGIHIGTFILALFAQSMWIFAAYSLKEIPQANYMIGLFVGVYCLINAIHISNLKTITNMKDLEYLQEESKQLKQIAKKLKGIKNKESLKTIDELIKKVGDEYTQKKGSMVNPLAKLKHDRKRI